MALEASFAPSLRSGANDATRATNKQYALQKSSYCPIQEPLKRRANKGGFLLSCSRFFSLFFFCFFLCSYQDTCRVANQGCGVFLLAFYSRVTSSQQNYIAGIWKVMGSTPVGGSENSFSEYFDLRTRLHYLHFIQVTNPFTIYSHLSFRHVEPCSMVGHMSHI